MNKMSQKKCRVCESSLNSELILKIPNMPNSAQGFLKEVDLEKDRPVSIEIIKCNVCGLVQTLGEPPNYWKSVIRATSVSEDMSLFRISQFSSFFKKNSIFGKKLIEIGSGSGDYLDLLKKVGFNVSGTEYDAKSIKQCEEKGLNVYKVFPEKKSDLDKLDLYDGIMCFNFLEHWPHPVKFLRNILKIIKKNGYGLIEVPNFDMILEKKLFSEFISDHVSYFTKNSLRTTLEISGFHVENINEIWSGYILSAEVKKRIDLETFSFESFRKELSSQFKKFKSENQNDGVAVWGAGHQALAILSTFELGTWVNYVVDSAKFKQFLFAPGSKLPIYPPDHLFKDKVSALIIIGAGFSDEILEIVKRKKYPLKTIAILREHGLEVL